MSMERAIEAVRRASLEWIELSLKSEGITTLEPDALLVIAEAEGVPVESVVKWIRAEITIERTLVAYRRWAHQVGELLREVPDALF
jgi:hypothetical protein